MCVLIVHVDTRKETYALSLVNRHVDISHIYMRGHQSDSV